MLIDNNPGWMEQHTTSYCPRLAIPAAVLVTLDGVRRVTHFGPKPKFKFQPKTFLILG
jgi:hypothetical protein